MEKKEDIHLYLNSELNKSEFPDNSPQGFTNIIRPTLNLDSSYEVALENIIFPSDIYTVEKNNEDYSVLLKVSYIGGYSRKEEIFEYTPRKNIYVSSTQKAIQAINDDLLDYLVSFEVIKGEEQKFIFKYRPNASDVVYFRHLRLVDELSNKYTTVTWKVGHKIKTLMGLGEYEFRNKPNIIHPPILPERVNCVYVYADFIEATNLGDQTVHLLDIIPMRHMHYKQRALAMFKPVTKSNINDISIRLTDEKGRNIPFTPNVSVTVVLHFKRTQ